MYTIIFNLYKLFIKILQKGTKQIDLKNNENSFRKVFDNKLKKKTVFYWNFKLTFNNYILGTLINMINLLVLTFVLAGAFYYFCIRPHTYWTKRGVKQSKPIWFFGNVKQVMLRQQTLFDWTSMLYNMFPQSR